MNSTSEKTTDRLLLALLTLAAAWPRLVYLDQPSLWWDEFITLGATMRPLADMLSVLRTIGPNDTGVELFPPLLHLLVKAARSLADNDLMVRLPGTVAGILLVPAVYLLCLKPLGRLSALSAALFVALSVYQIHFSREVRPYALFMLENVVGLWLLDTALSQGRRRLLWWYGAVVAAMFYTSYMAATLVFAQALYAGLFLAWRWRSGQAAQARREALTLTAALGLAGLAYLPWAKGQLLIFTILHDPDFKANLSWAFMDSSLREFAAFADRSEAPLGLIWGGAGLLGLLLALRERRGRFVLLVSLWAFMPLAGIFLAKARMELSSRYLISVSVLLSVFAGHLLGRIVEALSDRLGRGSPPIFAARAILAASLTVLASLPNLASLPEYYSRETSHYKDLLAALARDRDNADILLFSLPRNLKLITDWYGRDLLPTARNLPQSGYHRALLLAPESVRAADKLPGAVFVERLRDVDLLRLGLARTPVIPMLPDASGRFVHAEDFSGLAMLEQAWSASNLVPSPLTKTLSRHDAGRPGYAEFRYKAPRGTTLRSGTVELEISAFDVPGLTGDDALEISIRAAEATPVRLALADAGAFRLPDGRMSPLNHERKRKAMLRLPLPPALAGTGDLTLRLEYGTAVRAAAIEIESLRFEALLDGPPAPPQAAPLALLEQLPVAPWEPRADIALSRSLHAFSLAEGLHAPGLMPPKALEAYRAMRPHERPVRLLRFPDGSPAVALFDPALADPWLTLAPGRERIVEVFPPGRRLVAGIKLAGALHDPVLRLGALELPLPVTAPAPSRLTVNPNGQGELSFSPLFTADGLDADAYQAEGRLVRNKDEDCLSCQDQAPCSLTYTLRSGLPVTSVYLRAFPRVDSDYGRSSRVRTLLSADGGPWREINEYKGSGSGRWEGLKIPQYTLLRLDSPASEVRLRFELSGHKAQLWSAPDARMRLDLRLDASRLAAPMIDKWPVRVGASGPHPLRLLLLERPAPFPDRLRRTR